MYSLDFPKIHSYLFPTKYDQVSGLPISGRPDVPYLNPDHPRSGLHICRETIFTSGSLAFICYAKNLFDQPGDEKPSGVKLCLKLTSCTRKGRGRYGSPKNPSESVSVECTEDDSVGIWRVLRGIQSSYEIHLPLPGQQVKDVLFKHQPASDSPFYAKVAQGQTMVSVSFSDAHAIAFQAVIVALFRIRYTHLSADTVIALLDGVAKKPASMPTNADVLEPQEKTLERPLRNEGEEDMSDGLRKTVYAICLQRWPAKRKDVAQYIQKNAGATTAQQIVDAANQGDFKWLEHIADILDRNRFRQN